MEYAKESLKLHYECQGKIGVIARAKVDNKDAEEDAEGEAKPRRQRVRRKAVAEEAPKAEEAPAAE